MKEEAVQNKKTAASQSTEKEELIVDGMTCANCAQSVNNYLQEEGMEDITVDFASGYVSFLNKPDVDDQQIKKGIQQLGYKVKEEGNSGDQTYHTLKKKFIISLIFTIPLFSAMFLPFNWMHNPYVQLMLALPVYALGFYHFGSSAWHSLKSGVPNMDVLIFMGSSAAFFYSLTGTLLKLGPDYMFYETAGTIITLVLLGNLLEKKSVKQTTTAIDELSKLKPSKAKLITQEGTNEESVDEIPAEKLDQGQLVQVNSGDRIPADGTIIWGEGYADESMITGESNPVSKAKEDKAIGGTILTEGNIKVKVTTIGKDSVLSQIIDLVKNAQSSKPSIQRLGDRVSAIFVPVVVSIAIITFLISYFWVGIALQFALLRAVAVLVISCPCAMGLATPTAVMVGIGRAAKNGILIKGGKTLEQFANLKSIVFDKTGTLTSGQFKIKDLKIYQGNEANIKSIIHHLEQHSSHPIAQSIAKALPNGQPTQFKVVKEQKGIGLEAIAENGDVYQIGSKSLVSQKANSPEHQVYLLRNQELIAGIDIEDDVQTGAKPVVDYFNQQGIQTTLLSGDQEAKTKNVAHYLNIQNYHAEQQPEAKLRFIEQLSAKADTAMVGDGINDAPSLSRANIGISLSSGTEIAIQSAEVVLLNGKLSSLVDAHRLSKTTLTTIKQNLFWAFFYNVMAIPLAAIGLLNPMIAALAMAFSDVIVVGNSIRLKYRPLTKG